VPEAGRRVFISKRGGAVLLSPDDLNLLYAAIIFLGGALLGIGLLMLIVWWIRNRNRP
jgi:hypothetical protein